MKTGKRKKTQPGNLELQNLWQLLVIQFWEYSVLSPHFFYPTHLGINIIISNNKNRKKGRQKKRKEK